MKLQIVEKCFAVGYAPEWGGFRAEDGWYTMQCVFQKDVCPDAQTLIDIAKSQGFDEIGYINIKSPIPIIIARKSRTHHLKDFPYT